MWLVCKRPYNNATINEEQLKELKYKSFRFYFIVDGKKLKVFSKEELTDLLIKFVRMSDKKSQQKVIDEIRKILIKIGPEGFWEQCIFFFFVVEGIGNRFK